MFASFKGALAHKGRIMEYRNEKIELTKKLDAARELISNVIQPAIKAAEIYDQTIGLGAYTDHKKTLAMITDEIEFLIAYNRMIEAEAEAKYLESTLDKDAVAASLNAKISTLTKEVASSTQRIEELRGTSQSATERFNTLNEQNRKLDTLHGLFATLDRIDELDKKIEACESFKTVMVTLSEAKENIEKVGRDVNSIKNEISTLDYKIVQLGEVSLSLDKINYAMAKYDEIKMAASPITGVPSIAIDGFLDQSIKDDINTFLGHFFDGALRLVKFEVGDNTFDIVVTGGEKPMERDISRCSKSERRTTGLALSLALLKRSFTTDVKYNIVSMDEMDDGLDVMKKQIFFSILQNYFMENNSISQVFMSTHNPAVENTDSSFVLLKNSGVETQNIRPNRIIFNYSA
jgi:SpoU rRNA methylase family enzyme